MSENINKTIIVNLPFIPKYKSQLRNHITVWWFERKFCQTLYGKESKLSNACVIISVIIASKIERKKLQVQTSNIYCICKV